MQTLYFEIYILKPKHLVWKIMLSRTTYEEWVTAGWGQSTFDGQWRTGEKISFFGSDGSGTIAEVTDIKLDEYVKLEHIGLLLAGGKVDSESSSVKDWIGTIENYYFIENDNHTSLKIEIKTHPSWASMFEDGWPKALLKLKEICEK